MRVMMFALAVVILGVSTVAFAEQFEVANTEGSSVPGCQHTNSCFSPHTIIISVNDEIIWTNADLTSHTVTSGSLINGPDGIFNSGVFVPGQIFSHTFEEPGEYPYYCLAHPWMNGLIIVQETAANGAGTTLSTSDDDLKSQMDEQDALTYNIEYFVTTWMTDMPGESITIPTGKSAGTYSVDWGDGTTTTHEGNATHKYDAAGKYSVQIHGNFTSINLGADPINAAKLHSIDQWGTIKWTTMESAFRGASNMVYMATDVPDLSNVIDMSHMFADTDSFNGDISSWDVSSVRHVTSMFSFATSFNQPLDSWNVSSIKDMSRMFFFASAFDGDISSWNVSSVTDMSHMFAHANTFNQDISSWDVSGVSDMSYMFFRAHTFNQPLNSWNVSSVTDISSMFWFAESFNQPLNSWDVSQVTNMKRMFSHATLFNQDISSWDVSSVIYMERIFEFAHAFDQDLSAWNTMSDDP